MSTHSAVVTTVPRGRLAIHQVRTPTPSAHEILIHIAYTASTPLDLHQNDGHLLVTPPQILGDGFAGTVTAIGPSVTLLRPGDKVFGFAFQGNTQKAHQEYACMEEWMAGKIPEGFSMPEAVTLPNNFVTVFHTLTADLGLELPWPKPDGWLPRNTKGEDVRTDAILIWGGSSSVGQFALQVLRWYGFANVLATSSAKNFEMVRECGATAVFDYGDPHVVPQVKLAAGCKGVKLVLDCIGSQPGSITPISKIAGDGCKVAVLLPVIVRDASETHAPQYAMDVQAAAEWKDDVKLKGVRTHFWHENAFFRENLQTEIMPQMLAMGVVKPNRQKMVEGKTLLERAQKAMDMLRRKEVSGERLVWKVADNRI